MAIQVYCPNPACKNHTRPSRVPEDMAGRQVGCKACGLVLTIPEPRVISWWGPLAGGAAVIVAAAAIVWVLLGMTDSGGAPDPTPQAASLPDPFSDAILDKRNEPAPREQEALVLPAVKPKRSPVGPAKPVTEPAPRPPVEEPPAIKPTPTPMPERQPEPPPEPTPKPKREKPVSVNDVKFIIPFDAIGPAAKLDKIKVTQIDGRFSFATSPIVNPVTMTWQSIARFKWHEKASSVDIAFLVEGNKGWFGDGRKVRPMEPDGFSFYQNLAYSISLSNLIPLREKGFEVAKGEDAQVRGRDCFLARVKAEGRPEMKMYFDKQSGFLAKAEFRGRFFNFSDLKLQKDSTLLENYFGNYKKTDGVNHWRRYEQFRNGTKYAELNLDRVQFFEEVDDKWFAFEKGKPSPLRPVLVTPKAGKLPAADLGSFAWKITRVLPDKKKTSLKSPPALQVTVMFTTPQQPAKAGKTYRLVDADGLVLDQSALRFTSAARRYGILAFERILAGREQPVNLDGVFLEDEIGQRAPLQFGATARKAL